MDKGCVTEELPFGNDTLVFKVGGKIFLLTSLDSEITSINVKCDPELAMELRAKYAHVTPGYHMNKTHWNTILIDNSLSESFIKLQIDNSYQLVADSLPARQRKELFGK